MPHLIALGQYLGSHVLSTVAALAASYALGFTWHGPLFGKLWMSYNNMTPPKKEDMKFSMMLPGLTASGIMVIMQCAVLGRTFEILRLPSVWQALLISTVITLPFTAMVIVNSYAWMGKKFGHMVLDAGYYIIQGWIIAAIIFWML